jgi:hypothetical protein
MVMDSLFFNPSPLAKKESGSVYFGLCTGDGMGWIEGVNGWIAGSNANKIIYRQAHI